MLFVVALASGCANPTTSSYCVVAQRPFQWQSDTEIDQTPIRVVRYIESGAAAYKRLCR
jgi:hypothetical protein